MTRTLAGLALWLVALVAAAAPCTWPQWEQFQRLYVSSDGRVIDRSHARQITVSEGQAYALFFALVANDRQAFDHVLAWTEDNLAAGDLTTKLPAWQWGRHDDGRWAVLDDNSASDADLWIAYTLAEAARLWQQRRYRVLATLIGRNLLQKTTADLPGLGPSLLPAPVGFSEGSVRWRLNPSYAPPQVLRGLSAAQPGAGWERLIPTNHRLLLDSAPKGFSPDWALYDSQRGFLGDDKTRADGSYDAIRVYLWAGMLHADDPDRSALLQHFQPMARQVARQGTPPEHVDTRSGAARGEGYAGFSAALLPFLAAQGETAALATQRQRVIESQASTSDRAYFENVLTLFGQAWDQGRYRFNADGRLRLQWPGKSCAALR